MTEGRLQTFSALRHQGFRSLWVSSFLWSTCRWLEMVAVGWLTLEMTNSPFLLGIVAASRGIPLLALGALGGVLADRANRRTLLMLAQAGSALLFLILAWLLQAEALEYWHIVAVTLLNGTVMALTMPARQAFIYDLVGKGELLNAVAINAVAMNVTRVLGPSAGGLLIEVIGVAGCSLLMVALYLLGILALFFIEPAASKVARPEGSPWQHFIEGLRYVSQHQVVMALLLTEMVCDAFAFSYYAMMPVFARDILNVGAPGLGFLMAATGIGALLAALGVASLGDFKHKGWLLLGSTFFFGFFLVLFALSRSYPLSLFFLLGTGAMGAAFDAVMATLLQGIVPDPVRGRVMGTYVLSWGMAPLGGLWSGTLADLWGAPLAVGLGGVLAAAYAVGLAARLPPLRRLE